MESKSLITKEIAKLVQSAANNGCSLTPYEFSQCETFRIGRAKITRRIDENSKGSVTLYLDEDFDTQYSKIWNHDVGRVLTNELKKSEPKLFELKADLFTALIREIPSDDVDEQLMRGMVHLKIVDKAYTIIKVIKADENYLSNEKYNDYDIEEDSVEESNVIEATVPKKKDNEPLSYELF